jgi:hypothetical protein
VSEPWVPKRNQLVRGGCGVTVGPPREPGGLGGGGGAMAKRNELVRGVIATTEQVG